MTFKDALDFLAAQTNYEKKSSYNYESSLNLERIKTALAALGNPHTQFRSVQIAGTNGKGSTSCALAVLLSSTGARVGLYTSPHLYDITERIVVNGVAISKRAFAREVGVVKKALEAVPVLKKKQHALTYFEILTLVAFLYFARKKIDVLVCETGLGGRLDATNVLCSAVQIITPIAQDHGQILGNSIAKISREKAGIIKETSLVFSARQTCDVEKVLRQVAKAKKSRICFYGRSFNAGVCTRVSRGWKCTFRGHGGLVVPFHAKYQVENICLAVRAFDALIQQGIVVQPRKSIAALLRDMQWPGRFEIIKGRVPIVLDGAHNEHGMTALVRAIKKLYPTKKIDIIYATTRDKEYERVLRVLRGVSNAIAITEFRHERACSINELGKAARGIFTTVSEGGCFRNVLRDVHNHASAGSVVLVTGSLFLIAEARKILLKKGKKTHASK